MSKDFVDDVLHIEINVATASRLMPDFEFKDGIYFSADELNEKRMCSASVGILINDSVECDYLVALTDGTFEIGTW